MTHGDAALPAVRRWSAACAHSWFTLPALKLPSELNPLPSPAPYHPQLVSALPYLGHLVSSPSHQLLFPCSWDFCSHPSVQFWPPLPPQPLERPHGCNTHAKLLYLRPFRIKSVVSPSMSSFFHAQVLFLTWFLLRASIQKRRRKPPVDWHPSWPSVYESLQPSCHVVGEPRLCLQTTFPGQPSDGLP